MIKLHFFVYRIADPKELDERLPVAGVTAVGRCPTDAWKHAMRKALLRLRRKPGESLLLRDVRDADDRRNVELMEGDWERAHAKHVDWIVHQPYSVN